MKKVILQFEWDENDEIDHLEAEVVKTIFEQFWRNTKFTVTEIPLNLIIRHYTCKKCGKDTLSLVSGLCPDCWRDR